jgi:hypothetical protein
MERITGAIFVVLSARPLMTGCQCRCLHSERSTGLALVALDFVAYCFVLWTNTHDVRECFDLLVYGLRNLNGSDVGNLGSETTHYLC